MNRKTRSVFIWAAIGVQVVLVVISEILKALLPPTAAVPGSVYGGPMHSLLTPIFLALGALSLLSFPLVGAVIFARRPALCVGWLFCLTNIGWAINNFVGAFVLYAFFARPDWMPFASQLVWLYMWPGFVSIGLMIYLLLIFPDGRLLSPRWQWMVWAVVIDVIISVVSATFAWGPIDASLGVSLNNPLGLVGSLGRFFAWLTNVSPFPIIELLLIVVACASLILRYRSAQGEVRLQLRWLAASMVVVAIFIMIQLVLLSVYPFSPDMPPGVQILMLLSELSLTLIPVSAGIAILRYHLYDIDRIINRALVYGALTLSLALIYFGSVIILQAVVHGLTGRAESPVVTVISTLAIAALFAPLRRRIQAGIDLRFYRRKYDSERILTSFGSTLRSEVDLDQLCEQFLRVVNETFEPREVELWMKRGKG